MADVLIQDGAVERPGWWPVDRLILVFLFCKIPRFFGCSIRSNSDLLHRFNNKNPLLFHRNIFRDGNRLWTSNFCGRTDYLRFLHGRLTT